MIKIFTGLSRPIDEIMGRTKEDTNNVSDIVAEIIKNVRENGDKAVLDYTERFDGARPSSIEVTKEEIDAAYNRVDKEFLAIIEEAAAHIREYHEKQLRQNYIITPRKGAVLGQKITPIEKVGLYVPGGTARYPSSVLMNAVPAKIAGVSEVCMVTPPDSDDTIPDVLLAAAKIAGVDRVFKAGGAQAVAALAYGTESIPAVHKIVGPGNVFVAEAKRQVFGKVSIDMIAGPSEILVIADKTCKPANVAADLLSQAEHDKLASAVLVTDSSELAHAVAEEIEKQIPLLERSDIARASIDNNGKIFITDSLEDSISVANEIAPEHLELCVENPFDYLSQIKNAGSIFLGKYSPEALGDYFAGPNHTLPTGGTAKFSSPLSVDDFIKKSSFIYYTEDALKNEYKKVAEFANREGLTAHAKSAVIRFEEGTDK